MIYIPFLSAISLASGNILERAVLKRKKISIESYQVFSFLAIILTMLPFIYFFWNVNSNALKPWAIGVFLMVIALAIVANLLTFYSMKGAKLGSLESAKISEEIFIIILALIASFIIDGVFYERNFNVIIPAIIAGLALVFSHFKKDHVVFNKYYTAALLGSFFFALEMVISRPLLEFYSPFTFYFMRCVGVFLISVFIFRDKFKEIKNKRVLWEIFFTGIVWFIYRVSIYYGYLSLGIISTTLVVMLAPIMVFLFARIFLKEKLNWKNIVASIIIVGCILYVSLI